MTFEEYYNYCRSNKIDITKWKASVLHQKLMDNQPLTEAEVCAKLFLEWVGYVTWLWDNPPTPEEKDKMKKLV